MKGQHIFISYSREQFYYAESLALCLQSLGITTWFDVQCIAPGSDWQQRIQDGLNSCAGLILVASRDSLSSEYVRSEWLAVLAAKKPIYVVIFEAVKLPSELKTASIIDGRGSFNRKMRLLAEVIMSERTYRDRLPRPNPLRFPTRMPLGLFGLIFSLFLFMGILVIAQTEMANISLQELAFVWENNPDAGPAILYAAASLIFGWLLFIGYVFFFSYALIFHKRFSWLKIRLFIFIAIYLIAFYFVSDDVANHFLSGDLKNLLSSQYRIEIQFAIGLSILGGTFSMIPFFKRLSSSTTIRWLATGSAPERERILANEQFVQEIVIQRWKKEEKIETRTSAAHTPVSAPTRARTYQLYYHEADQRIANQVTKALSRPGIEPAPTKQVADYHIIILTEKISQELLNTLLQTTYHIVCILSANIHIPLDWDQIRRLQWFDYRKQPSERLAELASQLARGASRLEVYDFPVLPESLERWSVPWIIEAWTFLLRTYIAIIACMSFLLLLTLRHNLLGNELLQSSIGLFLAGTGFYLFLFARRFENRNARNRDVVCAAVLILCGLSVSVMISALLSSGGNVNNFWSSSPLDLGAAATFGIIFLSLFMLPALFLNLRNYAWSPDSTTQLNIGSQPATLSLIKRPFWPTNRLYLFFALELALILLAQFYEVHDSTLKWTTMQTFIGNGPLETATFTAPNDWKILYTCTYQDNGDTTDDGWLDVTVINSSDNFMIDQLMITCSNGVAKTTGDMEEHQGGQVYLDITDPGDWTVQVQGLQELHRPRQDLLDVLLSSLLD